MNWLTNNANLIQLSTDLGYKTFDLTEHPINIVVPGEVEVVFENDHFQLALVPSTFGKYVSMSFPNRREFAGAGVLISDGDNLLLVSQNRWAVGIQTWEMPIGGLEIGETPIEAAIRETKEETGILLGAEGLTSLGTVRPMTARTVSQNFLYFTNVKPTKVDHKTDGELNSQAWVPIEEVFNACLSGVISNESTIIAVLRARLLELL